MSCARRNDPAVIVEDNCCQCNYAALRRMIKVAEVEVVYATFHVDVGETPFFIALDYNRKKVSAAVIDSTAKGVDEWIDKLTQWRPNI